MLGLRVHDPWYLLRRIWLVLRVNVTCGKGEYDFVMGPVMYKTSVWGRIWRLYHSTISSQGLHHSILIILSMVSHPVEI